MENLQDKIEKQLTEMTGTPKRCIYCKSENIRSPNEISWYCECGGMFGHPIKN